MGWKFWQREQTEAEKSLEALEQAAAAPVAEPVASSPAVDEAARAERARVEAEGEQLGRDLEAAVERVMATLHRTPELAHLDGGETAFGFYVRTSTAGADGTTVLTAVESHGTVEPGDVVGLMLVDGDARDADLLADPTADLEAQGVAAQALMEAMARAEGAVATVVAWRPEQSELVLTGVVPGVVTPGTTVMR